MIIPATTEVCNLFAGAALALAERGLRVFPVHSILANQQCSCGNSECGHPGKHPATSGGLLDATADAAQIHLWAANFPHANVAIRTGPESGVFVIDADGQAGVQAVDALQASLGKLPPTWTSKTGGGGRHFFFKYPLIGTVANVVKLDGLPIDVRGVNGSVNVPPSNHASGSSYEWVYSPFDGPLAPAPDFLLKMVLKKQSPAAGPTASPVSNGTIFKIHGDLDLASASGATKGERHLRALALVGRALRQGQAVEKVEEQALEWANRCMPPMPEEEIQTIVADLAAKEASRASQQSQDQIGWDLPIPFDSHDLPAFPTETLPDWWQYFVRAEAEATQTPEDLTAMITLAVVAAACAKKVEVFINSSYREPLNLFTIVALTPGNRKSSVFDESTLPLREFEEAEAKKMAPEVKKKETHKQIEEKRLTKLIESIPKALPPEQKDLREAADKIAQEIAVMVVPTIPRVIASDSTAEKLGQLLAENGGRMAVLSPEGDVFAIMNGRYGSKGTANFGVYLNGHSGDDIRVDRIGRLPDFVKRPALTLGLAVQPSVIHGLADQPAFRARGLLGRFLYSLPASSLGHRKVDPPPVHPTVREAYKERILSLLKLAPALQEPHMLQLSHGAHELRLKFTGAIEPKLATGGELGAMTDWGAKLVGGVLRVAGILHMAQHAVHLAPWETPIAAITMQNAIHIGEYLIAHARAAFAEMGADPTVSDAKYLVDWLCRAQVGSFTVRQAFEETKGRFKRVGFLTPALELLVDHGFLRQRAEEVRTGPGRRPSPTYDVNPHTYSQNSHNSQKHQSAGCSLNSAHIANNTTAPVPPVEQADGVLSDLTIGCSLDSAHIANNATVSVPPFEQADSTFGDTNIASFEEGVI